MKVRETNIKSKKLKIFKKPPKLLTTFCSIFNKYPVNFPSKLITKNIAQGRQFYNIEISDKCHLPGMTSNTTTMVLEMTSNTSIRSLLSGMTSNTSVMSGMSGMSGMTSNTTTVLSEPSSFYIWTAAFIFLLVNLILIFIKHT